MGMDLFLALFVEMRDLHVVETLNDLSDCILLHIVVFDLLSIKIQPEENDGCDKGPDTNTWVSVGFCPLHVSTHFLVVNSYLVSFKTHDCLRDFLNVNLFRLFLGLGVLSTASLVVRAFRHVRTFFFVVVVLELHTLILQEM